MATLHWNAHTERYEGTRLTVTGATFRAAVAAAVDRAHHQAREQHRPFDAAAVYAATETAYLDEARWSPDDHGVDTVPVYPDGATPATPDQPSLLYYRFGPAPDRAFDDDGPLAGVDAAAVADEAYTSPRATALFAALGVSPDEESYVLGALPGGRWALHGPLVEGNQFVVEAG